MTAPRAAIAGRIRRAVTRLVARQLAEHGVPRATLPPDPLPATGRLDALERRIAALERRDAPIGPDTTVADLLARQPAAAAVLARLHLPSCATCPVAEDETLDEVARSHGFSLVDLLAALGAPA